MLQDTVMSVLEASPGKKAKKLKSQKNKITDGIPADDISKPVKKSKKNRISNGDGVTDAEKVSESTKKSGKKRKKEEEEISSGVVEGTQGDSPEATETQKSVKKRKKRKTLSENAEDAADTDAINDASEESPAAASLDKKPRSKKGENPVKPKNPEHEQRTVFVGNLPLKTQRRQLRNFFMKFGQVESVRLRSAPRLDAKKPIRMAVITHRFSEDRSSFNGYVRFVSEADAQKAAAEANGQVFKEHRLRVNLSLEDKRPDPRRAVFVGGLPLNVEDDQLWTRFVECGEIVSVRIVRDRQTSIGKGIGYVNFAEEEAVAQALKLNGSELEGRTIRVQRCHATAHAKVDRDTGKKLRKARDEGGKSEVQSQDDKLAPVNKFSGDATAESKSSLKKKKGAKKQRWDDAKRQKRNLAQSLSKTIAPAAAKPAPAPVVSIGGVTPQNKKIKFDFDDDTVAPSEKKNDSEKLKEIKMKKEAKRKKKAKETVAKKKKNIVEPLTNILPS